MFVLGFHFPADMGNSIPSEKVVERLDAAVSEIGGIDDVKEIKLLMVSREGQKEEISFTNKSTFLFKALAHYAKSTDSDYMIYTNRYQMAEISKQLDASDDETMALCKKFDSMAQFRITAA